MSLSKNNILVSISIILVFLLFLQKCGSNNSENELISKITAYQDSAKHFKLALGEKDSIMIATNNVLVLENEKQVRLLAEKNDTVKKLLKQFKSIKSIVINKGAFVLVNDTIKLHDSIPCDFNPIKVDKSKTYYKLFGTLTRKSFVIDTLIIPNNQTIVIGEKRVGLFGSKTTVDIANSNPYINVNKISGYTVHEKKWYQNRWVFFGVGAFVTSSWFIFLNK